MKRANIIICWWYLRVLQWSSRQQGLYKKNTAPLWSPMLTPKDWAYSVDWVRDVRQQQSERLRVRKKCRPTPAMSRSRHNHYSRQGGGGAVVVQNAPVQNHQPTVPVGWVRMTTVVARTVTHNRPSQWLSSAEVDVQGICLAMLPTASPCDARAMNTPPLRWHGKGNMSCGPRPPASSFAPPHHLLSAPRKIAAGGWGETRTLLHFSSQTERRLWYTSDEDFVLLSLRACLS